MSWDWSQFGHQLPLLVFFAVPLVAAVLGLRNVALKSVIHFQQGTLGTSPWRVAVTMTFITAPVFFAWCMCVRGASAMFFQVGASCALLLTTFAAASILHYVPSPCISKFYQLRFLSDTLRGCVTTIQCLLLLIMSVLVLSLSATFLSSASGFSVFMVLPLFAYVSLFAVIFSGHSSTMSITLLLYIATVVIGFGMFLYNAVEDVASFGTIIPMKYGWTDSIVSFFMGFIVNWHFLNSSTLYQTYSPMPTIHKLRLSLLLYGVSQLFVAVFVFVLATLFHNFLDQHCTLPVSFDSFVQFTKVTVGMKFQAYAMCTACLCVLSIGLQWCLLALINELWEETMAKKLHGWNPLQQLCAVQFVLLICTTLVVVLTVAAHLAKVPVGQMLPTLVFVVFSLFAMLAALVACGYLLPFCSSKGAMTAIFVAFVFISCNLTFYFANNPPVTLANTCSTQGRLNTTLSQRSMSMDRVVYAVSHLPLQTLPIITFCMFVAVCAFVSFLTGGQDQMSLDWNLIAFTWATSVRSPTSFSKRPFVDTESFRYAQQQQTSASNPSIDRIYR